MFLRTAGAKKVYSQVSIAIDSQFGSCCDRIGYRCPVPYSSPRNQASESGRTTKYPKDIGSYHRNRGAGNKVG